MKLFGQKTLFILAITVFFVFAQKAEAGLEITEIMYSPEMGANYEWVEIYNNGNNSIDLNKYRFFHGEDNSGPLTLRLGQGTVLEPNGYALIVKSLSDYSWLEFTQKVFSASTLSLPDSGDNTYIAISDSNMNKLDFLTYDISLGGSKASGTSLSKISGAWTSGIPTQGKENSPSGYESEDSSSEDSSSGSSTNVAKGEKKKEIILNPVITTKIITKKIAVAGIPFEINHETIGYKNEKKILGRFVWNFGDGMIREEEYSAPFSYTYEYPGEYALTLSFYDTHFSLAPEATDRVNIKVIPSGINIASVGPASDPYIEIENNSTYEMTLYKWIIKGNTHSFTIPAGTIILPNKKIKLSPKITGFDASDLNSVVIYDDKGTVFAVYPKQKVYTPTRVSSSNYSTNKNTSPNSFNPSTGSVKEEEVDNKNVIDLNSLGASAESSGSKIPRSVYPWIGLTVIIILGILGILSIQKKNKEPKDYMDDEVRPGDITIME